MITLAAIPFTVNPVALGATTCLLAGPPVFGALKQRTANAHWALRTVVYGGSIGMGAATMAAVIAADITLWPALPIGIAGGAILLTALESARRVTVKAHRWIKTKSATYTKVAASLQARKERLADTLFGRSVKYTATVAIKAGTVLWGLSTLITRGAPLTAAHIAATPALLSSARLYAANTVLVGRQHSIERAVYPMESYAFIGVSAVATYAALAGIALPVVPMYVAMGLTGAFWLVGFLRQSRSALRFATQTVNDINEGIKMATETVEETTLHVVIDPEPKDPPRDEHGRFVKVEEPPVFTVEYIIDEVRAEVDPYTVEEFLDKDADDILHDVTAAFEAAVGETVLNAEDTAAVSEQITSHLVSKVDAVLQSLQGKTHGFTTIEMRLLARVGKDILDSATAMEEARPEATTDSKEFDETLAKAEELTGTAKPEKPAKVTPIRMTSDLFSKAMEHPPVVTEEAKQTAEDMKALADGQSLPQRPRSAKRSSRTPKTDSKLVHRSQTDTTKK